MKTLVLGDIHEDFQVINWLVETQQPNVILQVGDFGFWPELHGWPPEDPSLKNGQTLIYFADGNHEDHHGLSLIAESGDTEICPNVYYQPRGSIVSLPDGQNILFFGGASSGDKWRRTEGEDWFQSEVPSVDDLEKIPDPCKIDIVISHTAPSAFNLRKSPPMGYAKTLWLQKHEEQTRSILDKILFKYKPARWYFGHFHIFQEGVCEETATRWTALAMPMEEGEKWWIELDS